MVELDIEICRKAYEEKYYKSHFVVWNGERYVTKPGYELFEKHTILVNNGFQYWKDACEWQASRQEDQAND